ncbi:MAG: acyltransferase [Aquificaceae bacterium]|nr:acyltransferase [Aquificaceae bacterium]
MSSSSGGLDALRGLLSLTVLAYHYFALFYPDSNLIPGGYLAVEVFFVLSGYLITKSLKSRFSKKSPKDALLEFIQRRFFRIFPGLLFLLITCLISYNLLGAQGQNLLSQSIFALFGVYNYYLTLRQVDYFEQFNPLALTHLWSLSIEIQLYLLSGVIFFIFKNPIRAFGAIFFISLLFQSLYALAVFKSELAYTHTEARAYGFALGAILAMREFNQPRGNILPVFSLLGLIALFGLADIYNELSYPLWFLLADILGATLIISLRGENASAPLRWLGKRSYLLYLFHYPVFVLLKENMQEPTLSALIIAALVILALCELGHNLLEKPYYGESISFAKAGAGLITYGYILSILTIKEPHKSKEKPILDNFNAQINLNTSLTTIKPNKTTQEKRCQALLIGDSVMLGASDYIRKRYPNVILDAKVGRQARELPELLKSHRENLLNCKNLILHLGTNGVVKSSQLKTALAEVPPDVKIYIITVNAPVSWKKQVNKTLESISAEQKYELLRWDEFKNPSFFAKDRIHLTSSGIRAYTELIAKSAKLQ